MIVQPYFFFYFEAPLSVRTFVRSGERGCLAGFIGEKKLPSAGTSVDMDVDVDDATVVTVAAGSASMLEPWSRARCFPGVKTICQETTWSEFQRPKRNT